MKGKALGPGDLKQAASYILPGLVNKLKREMDKDLPSESKKEKLHSFTKVSLYFITYWLIEIVTLPVLYWLHKLYNRVLGLKFWFVVMG